MCGITGILIKEIDKEKVIQEMTSVIVHRGPDQDGFFVDGDVGLGMRRLSIIDLSTGKQPIFSEDKNLCIFFNGEIYNYKELREDLVKEGVLFSTQTDTEVILHMYRLYGESMLTKLRGMFAFSIYNIKNKTLFLARDFFGIKPLYYFQENNKIKAFSSEIKSFLSIPGFEAKVNDEAVYNYLSFQYNPLKETFFENVYKLPPAHFMNIDLETGNFDIKKYWSFEFEQNEKLNKEETEKKIYDVMYDSVSHHMISDVSVGSFLSGGIDSSIIATLMQKISGTKKIKTFTVGFSSLTEGKEAKETSSFLGTDHTEITIGPEEYFKILSKAVWHFDEPIADPSAIGLYFVAREARKHVTVVLSGEGSDELFGGYNIYLEPFARKRVSWIPSKILTLLLEIPVEFFGKNYIRRASKRLSDWYIGNASVFVKGDLDKLWKKDGFETHSLLSLYSHTANQSESTQMQYVDINTWLIGDILSKADKMTMANSLELRVPFLDKEVADLARTLPDSFKWKNGVTKYLLREAFKKVIPENTRNRKKLGFPTPVQDWFTKDRKDLYNIILENEYIKQSMNLDYIKDIINNHTSKKVNNSRKIYLLLMLALWYEVFILKSK
ncbi:MAG: asparagine synthase (glutamine-hydrolyzing) [Candidatus Paceibacterota bacterium]